MSAHRALLLDDKNDAIRLSEKAVALRPSDFSPVAALLPGSIR